MAVIYRAVHFAKMDYESVDINGYLGNITRDILHQIEKHNIKVEEDPFYASEKISQCPW